MIRDLEAKVSLLLDDLFYARAEIAKMPSDIYLCPPTSENDYEGLKWCDAYEKLERENAALRADNQAAHALVLDLRTKEHSERTLAVKLERENAALRADKERLEWIETNARLTRKVGYLRWSFEGPECGTVRGSIDIARGKEAQP